jgi:hypothetical protein
MKKTPRGVWGSIAATLLFFNLIHFGVAQDNILIIDDRNHRGYLSTSGSEWRLITDRVMGGISAGQLFPEVVANQTCLRLQGDVKLDNNGGFIQAALDLSKDTLQEIQNYTGLSLAVQGNNEQYNVHLRTRDNSLPWQSYRATFTATPEWNELHIPFVVFVPYRTSKALDISRLTRIGIVAIGREFRAELCIGKLGLYK